MGPFDWSQYPVEGSATPNPTPSGTGAMVSPAPSKGAKFDWSQYPVEGQAKDNSAPADPGALKQFTQSTIDSLPAIGGMVGGVLGTPADVIAGPAGNVAGAAIGGYLGTAAKNLINTYYDPGNAPKNAKEVLTQPLTGGAEQGAIQGVGEFTAPYITKGFQAAGDAIGSGAKWAGTKLLSNFGGVNPDIIQEYAKYSDRIKSAPNVEALKQISDEFVGKLSADVDAKKITIDQAQEAMKGFQSDTKAAYQTAGYDARGAVTSAKQTLQDAHNSRIQNLSGDIYDTVNQLKSDVQKGSGEALKTLDNSDAMIDLAPTHSAIDSTIAKLQKAGTDESIAIAGKLQNYKQRLIDNYPGGAVPAPDAKKLIQGLDQTTTYSPMAGSFDQAKNAAFKGIRGSIDQTLKGTVPEYAEKMGSVAADTDLLNRVSDFGDKQTGAGILGRIQAPNQMERKAALQELGQKYNADFVGAADPKNLPEQTILNKAQAVQDSLRPDLVNEKINQTLASSRQQSALDAAQTGLDQSQQNLAPFKSLAPNSAGQTQAQQKLAQLGQGKNIELEGMFRDLGKLTDTDFVQAMKDQNTLAAFQKGATNGSRNTLMGGLVGFMFGGVPGMAGGGATGRAIDQWGPAITKKVLDGAIQVSKSPTVQTISNLSLPEPIKQNMIRGLQNYEGALSKPSLIQSATRNVASDQQPSGEDRWAQQGIQKLGIQDSNYSNRLLSDPKAKQLLIQASDLQPGSKAMINIQNQIKKGWGQ